MQPTRADWLDMAIRHVAKDRLQRKYDLRLWLVFPEQMIPFESIRERFRAYLRLAN